MLSAKKRNLGKKGWDWCSCSFSCHPFLYHYFRSLYQYISPLYHYILYIIMVRMSLRRISYCTASPAISSSCFPFFSPHPWYKWAYNDDKMKQHHIYVASCLGMLFTRSKSTAREQDCLEDGDCHSARNTLPPSAHSEQVTFCKF